MPDQDLYARLGRQSLRRALRPEEIALAAALEQIFAAGQHDFTEVAQALQARNITRPSGAAGDWTPDVLERELAAINADLDKAYAENDLL